MSRPHACPHAEGLLFQAEGQFKVYDSATCTSFRGIHHVEQAPTTVRFRSKPELEESDEAHREGLCPLAADQILLFCPAAPERQSQAAESNVGSQNQEGLETERLKVPAVWMSSPGALVWKSDARLRALTRLGDRPSLAFDAPSGRSSFSTAALWAWALLDAP